MTDMGNIFENISEIVPEDVVESVSPCRKPLNRILVGFALCTVTLNFLLLNYILPTVGILLLLLGTRTLKKENVWFKSCFVLSCIRCTVLFISLITETTVLFRSTAAAFGIVNTVVVLIQFTCFRNGLRQLQKKAGTEVDSRAATALIFWYVVIIMLALVQYRGYIIALGMLVCYCFIIRSLWKISKALGEAGYAVNSASVKISDKCLTVSAVLILTAGIFFGYAFGGNYRMDWRPVVASENTEVFEIRSQLEGLGFPKDVLEDLSDDDILACKGALDVVVDVRDHPVNDGREVREYLDGGFYTTTEYDKKELRITGIAVKLPTEREQWKIFHHFKWVAPHSKYGTECIQLWPAYRQGNGWVREGDVSGRILCDINGVANYSDYHYIGTKTYTSDGILFGRHTSRDVFAEFSMNRNGEDHRGYLSYTTSETIDGYILDSWMNYVHQKTWLQFPAKTAMEHRMTSGFGSGGAFVTVQDALQIHNGELL